MVLSRVILNVLGQVGRSLCPSWTTCGTDTGCKKVLETGQGSRRDPVIRMPISMSSPVSNPGHRAAIAPFRPAAPRQVATPTQSRSPVDNTRCGGVVDRAYEHWHERVGCDTESVDDVKASRGSAEHAPKDPVGRSESWWPASVAWSVVSVVAAVGTMRSACSRRSGVPSNGALEALDDARLVKGDGSASTPGLVLRTTSVRNPKESTHTQTGSGHPEGRHRYSEPATANDHRRTR